jgi:hypothetical protein
VDGGEQLIPPGICHSGGRRSGGLVRVVPGSAAGRPRVMRVAGLVAGLALQLALGLALLSAVG